MCWTRSRWRLATIFISGLAMSLPGFAALPPAQLEAARLLTQTSFGPTFSAVQRAALIGPAAYVDEQLEQPPSLHLPLLRQRFNVDNLPDNAHEQVWWERSINAPDQLRQRVAFALSEILVVSSVSDVKLDGMAYYYDVLLRNAFGNYRNLLEEVTLSPAMGEYLSMLGNRKADPEQGIRADENFAREIMQLFSLGLWQLNPDGSRRLDAARQPIATYEQSDVENLARVFTGWYFADAPRFGTPSPNWVEPMQAFPEFHDSGSKLLLGTSLPAGVSPITDLRNALNVLFAQPSVGPFVSQRLIQRLVTSNPSPAYLARISAVFANNGAGIRGDLKAVVRSILLDPEARDGPSSSPRQFGKVREPLLRLANLWRSVGVRWPAGEPFPFKDASQLIGQGPMQSPSVFNFFLPAYSPPGTLQSTGILAPELQLLQESNYTAGDNQIDSTLLLYAGSPNPNQVLLDFEPETTLARNITDLMDRLDLLLTSGQLSAAQRQEISTQLGFYTEQNFPREYLERRVVDALYLILASPQYLVQK